MPSAAPKGHKRSVGNKGGTGRPTLYKPEYAEIARKLCLLKHATDLDLAKIFDVAEATINVWKLKYPKFSSAIHRGKHLADADVAASLYERAIGYTHEAVKIFMPAGATAPVYAKYQEHYPPETGAAKHWLNNRQPGFWRERIEHSGEVGMPVRFIVEGAPGILGSPTLTIEGVARETTDA